MRYTLVAFVVEIEPAFKYRKIGCGMGILLLHAAGYKGTKWIF